MILLAADTPQISLVAQPVFQIGSFNVTNSMLLGLVGTVLCFAILLHTRRRAITKRHTRLSIAVLWLFEWLLDQATEVLGNRRLAAQVAPLAIAMFFFIIINNWLEILPIVGPLSLNGHQLFRGLAADLNFTLSLAIITLVASQLWAIKQRGLFGSLGRYFANPFKDPLHAFEGILEFIAELSRTLALALRLFGNIFGGEVLILVMIFLASWATPVVLPVFMGLELFVGAVQAYIFFMLTVTFISLGSSPRATAHPTEAAAATEPAKLTMVTGGA